MKLKLQSKKCFLQIKQTKKSLNNYSQLVTKIRNECNILVKAYGDLARYLPNVLPVTRQNQVAGQLPSKAYASVTYSDK